MPTLDGPGLRNRPSDYGTDRDVVDRDSAENEVRHAGHSLAKGSVVDTLDPSHSFADQYLGGLIENAEVFIRVLD